MPKTESSRREIINRGTVAALLLLGFGVAVWIWQARATGLEQLSSATSLRFNVPTSDAGESSLTLFDGKKIFLDQNEAAMIKALGSNLSKAKTGIYQYPLTQQLQPQVMIFADGGRVSTIMVLNNSANYQNGTGARVGMTVSDLNSRMGSKIESISSANDLISGAGYKYIGLRYASYYMLPACLETKDSISTIMMTVPGYAERLSKLLSAPNCSRYPPGMSGT